MSLEAILWWTLAGLAVAVELGTGTFYLLMVALGLAAAAVGAHAGLTLGLQIATAAVVGGGATAAWHFLRARTTPLQASHDPAVNSDIGERVHVAQWQDDGSAQVHYRGSNWQARIAPGHMPRTGLHVVTAVAGNWLVLTPVG